MRLEVATAREEMIAFRAEMNKMRDDMRAELQEWREQRDRIERDEQSEAKP